MIFSVVMSFFVDIFNDLTFWLDKNNFGTF